MALSRGTEFWVLAGKLDVVLEVFFISIGGKEIFCAVHISPAVDPGRSRLTWVDVMHRFYLPLFYLLQLAAFPIFFLLVTAQVVFLLRQPLLVKDGLREPGRQDDVAPLAKAESLLD